MNALQRVDHWHRTTWGLLIAGLLELVLAYALGSRAIDTGSLWQYALALIFLIGMLRNVIKLIKSTVAVNN